MKARVTQEGVLIPKELLEGATEVEIRKEQNAILVLPVMDDPIRKLGQEPIACDISDASELHDRYIYGG